MVIPAPGDKPLEIRSTDGQVIGDVVSVEQLDRLRAAAESLRAERDELQRRE